MKKITGYRHKLILVSVLVWCMVMIPLLNAADAFTITVDPGHGGHDPGAIGTAGTNEKDLNLDIGLRLRDLLNQQGEKVVMTRDTDEYIGLVTRTDVASQVYSDLFVSIHNNSSTSSSITGTQVLYYYNPPTAATAPEDLTPAMMNSEKNQELAKTVLNSVISEVGTVNRGTVVRNGLSVLRRATMPAILVEAGFVSNPQEEQQLNKEEFRQKIAQAICDGIQAYLKANPPQPGTFYDTANHWSKDNIALLAEKGIAKGDNGFFYPDRDISRAEVAALAVRALGLQPKPEDNTFPDVPPMHWAAGEIAAAKEQGIINGYSDGNFHPDDLVKRSEMAKMLGEAMVSEGLETKQAQANSLSGNDPESTTSAVNQTEVKTPDVVFNDILGNWARSYIILLAENGITQGYADGTFRPEEHTTRGEVAAFVARLIVPELRIPQGGTK